jgi:hypothetical protein
LSEVRWTDAGEFEKDGYKIIYSGRDDGLHQQGVGMLISTEAKKALLGYDTVGPRIIKARFKTTHGKATVIQVYAPTADCADSVIDEFYALLQQTVNNTSNTDLMVIMGDFNAKVGTDWKTWKGAIGKFGHGEENERGERLLQFCLNNNLKIMNTVFYQRKANRKWTWESPNGKTHNMIDFIIVNRRWETSVSMCRAFPKADVGSDHQLVMAAVKIKLKRIQKQIPERRFDVDNLKKEATKLEYQNAIKEQAEKLEAELHCDKAESQVEHLWERIKQIYTETATKVLGFKNKVKRAPWISDEILELSDKRQQLKQKKSSNPTSRKEYNKLTKEIKRMSKKCKEEWIEGKCRELQISDVYNDTQQL